MFFLLRVAFWLTIVLALLPSGGGTQGGASAKVDATDAVVAAGAAVSDMTSFCERQPSACEVGAQTAVAIGQRAQAGAKMVYDLINDHATRGSDERAARIETGSVAKGTARIIPLQRSSQTTLKSADLEPGWQTPGGKAENVPLPRPRPRPAAQHKA
jgi:hypothetical protein